MTHCRQHWEAGNSESSMSPVQLLLRQTYCKQMLVVGCIQEEYIVSHIGDLLLCLRACNATLRWSLLHLSGTQKKLRAAVAAQGPSIDSILSLLLDTAALEHEVRRMLGSGCYVFRKSGCPNVEIAVCFGTPRAWSDC